MSCNFTIFNDRDKVLEEVSVFGDGSPRAAISRRYDSLTYFQASPLASDLTMCVAVNVTTTTVVAAQTVTHDVAPDEARVSYRDDCDGGPLVPDDDGGGQNWN